MSTAGIEAAFNSIPAQRDELKKSFEDLQSSSSSFSSFSLQWKDIHDYLSFVENSIRERFQELKAGYMLLETEKPAASIPTVVDKEDKHNPEFDSHPELKFLCINMDAKALRLRIAEIQEDIEAIRGELGRALVLAPDPVTLVLDFFEDSNSDKKVMNVFLILLEFLHELAPEIKPLDKKRARRVAVECKGLITNGRKKKNLITVLAFFYLSATFGLVEFFVFKGVLDLLVLVAEMKSTVDLCRHPLLEAKVPDLIEKLKKEKREMDSLKFIIAFNLLAKYPVGELFKGYIDRRKMVAQLTNRRNPNYEVILKAREIACLQKVIKTVQEYNLESIYPCDNLRKRITELERKKYETRGIPMRTGPSDCNNMGKQQQHQRPIKRPRSSSDSIQIQPQSQPQLGLIDSVPHMGLADPFGSNVAPPFYFPEGVSLSGNPFGLGGAVFPQNLYPYPYDAMRGPAYHGMMAYGGYSNPGFPFDPSHYHP